MLEWTKIESDYYMDSRIRTLLDEMGFSGLGIYFAIRIAIETININGIPFPMAISACLPRARKNKIERIIYEFDLFFVSEDDIVSVKPLNVSSNAFTRACVSPNISDQTPEQTTEQTSEQTPEQATEHKPEHNLLVNDRKEKKRKEEKRACFRKPSLEEVTSYCQERHNGINPQGFIDFYESKGWKVGNQTMKDWKAAVRTWESRQGSMGTGTVTRERSVGSRLPVPSDPSQYNTYEKPTIVNCQQIPPDAPPKPSPNAQWDFATDSWNEFY